MAEITIEIDGLDDFIQNVQQAGSQMHSIIATAMSQSIHQIKDDAQNLAPYVSGNLRRSIYTDIQDNGLTGIVAQDPNIAPYGVDIEFGTRPHTIYPVNKKALFWAGAMHPVRKVNHPGTRAQPYLIPAFQQNIQFVTDTFQKAVAQILAIAAGQ